MPPVLLARRIRSISALITTVGVSTVSAVGSSTDGSSPDAYPHATAYTSIMARVANASMCNASAPGTAHTSTTATTTRPTTCEAFS